MDNWIHSKCYLDSCGECHCNASSERIAYFTCYSWGHFMLGILFAWLNTVLKEPWYIWCTMVIILDCIYEIVKNTYIGIRMWKFVNNAYEGNSIGNSIMNIACSIVGFFFGYIIYNT